MCIDALPVPSFLFLGKEDGLLVVELLTCFLVEIALILMLDIIYSMPRNYVLYLNSVVFLFCIFIFSFLSIISKLKIEAI